MAAGCKDKPTSHLQYVAIYKKLLPDLTPSKVKRNLASICLGKKLPAKIKGSNYKTISEHIPMQRERGKNKRKAAGLVFCSPLQPHTHSEHF